MLDLIEQDYGIKIEKVIGARPQLMDRILNTPDWASLQQQLQDLAKSVQFYLSVTKTTMKEKKWFRKSKRTLKPITMKILGWINWPNGSGSILPM
ncbi:hypothetical protein ACFTAO_34120 [Paenibacillus rhizoplanae]